MLSEASIPAIGFVPQPQQFLSPHSSNALSLHASGMLPLNPDLSPFGLAFYSQLSSGWALVLLCWGNSESVRVCVHVMELTELKRRNVARI